MVREPAGDLGRGTNYRRNDQHAFRWDHALAFARWLLKDEYPRDIHVYLIEIASLEPGVDLSPPVAQAMERLIELLLEELKGGRVAK